MLELLGIVCSGTCTVDFWFIKILLFGLVALGESHIAGTSKKLYLPPGVAGHASNHSLWFTGWWFQTVFIFHNIWDVILPIDELIFFKMVIATTNRSTMVYGQNCSIHGAYKQTCNWRVLTLSMNGQPLLWTHPWPSWPTDVKRDASHQYVSWIRFYKHSINIPWTFNQQHTWKIHENSPVMDVSS